MKTAEKPRRFSSPVPAKRGTKQCEKWEVLLDRHRAAVADEPSAGGCAGSRVSDHRHIRAAEVVGGWDATGWVGAGVIGLRCGVGRCP
jgi:hypothetical protein